MKLVDPDEFAALVGDSENEGLFADAIFANNIEVDMRQIFPYWFMESIAERLEERGFDPKNCCAVHSRLEDHPIKVMIFNTTWDNLQNIYHKTLKLKAFL